MLFYHTKGYDHASFDAAIDDRQHILDADRL
jgi:hypothetical protein